MAQASPGKLDHLRRTPAGSTALAFDGTGLCGSLPARPAKDASYPVSVRQVAALLHTSFRRHLAETPLCFASPSPPSGWTGDSHSPAIEHAGHTTNPLPRESAARRAVRGEGLELQACLTVVAVWGIALLLGVLSSPRNEYRRTPTYQPQFATAPFNLPPCISGKILDQMLDGKCWPAQSRTHQPQFATDLYGLPPCTGMNTFDQTKAIL